MIGGVQQKILVHQDENGNLKMDDEMGKLLFGDPNTHMKYKLVREHDGLTNQSKEIMWLDFNDEGRFEAKYDKPAIGRSLLMSPFNQFFTWQTTPITEIVEGQDDYIKFKTKNSNYELWKLKK